MRLSLLDYVCVSVRILSARVHLKHFPLSRFVPFSSRC